MDVGFELEFDGMSHVCPAALPLLSYFPRYLNLVKVHSCTGPLSSSWIRETRPHVPNPNTFEGHYIKIESSSLHCLSLSLPPLFLLARSDRSARRVKR